MPNFGLALGSIYVLGGWLLFVLLFKFDLPFLVYPLAAGFALIAPFIVTGLYFVSREIEEGRDVSWSGLIGSIRHAAKRDMGWMALITGFALVVWMDIAAFLFFVFLGLDNPDFRQLIEDIFTTQSGLIFLGVGNVMGAAIALSVFSISVVSFPMLFEKDVDFVTAMITSVRVVKHNPQCMVVWCGCIAFLMGLGFLTALIGLVVILPVLGHASWHLYRGAVELKDES